jgi:hypothetical protein
MPTRLLFFPDYFADPIWQSEGGGMVSLEDLPLSDSVRLDAREWSRRWEKLAWQDQAADGFSSGMSSQPAEAVSEEEWASVEQEGRSVWERLQRDLGGEWLLEWAYP